MAMESAPRHVHVIGAGIVGSSCAWWLKRAGLDVTLIDKGEPGDGASLGNAGSIGLSSVPPLGMPGMTKDLPKMLMDPLHPLVIRLGYFHKALPWLLKFRRSLKKERVEAIADARAALIGQASDAYDTMLGESGLEDMVFSRGLIFAHESEEGLAKSQYALDMRRKRGVRVEEMTGDQLRELEPALSDDVKCGVFFPDVRTTVNPQRLTKEFAKDFVQRGGKILRETVRGLEVGPDGPTKIHTDAGSHDCDMVVLSAGAWSKPLAAQLGTKVYLEAERGYHIMIADPGVDVKIPLAASDRNVSMNHMEHGLRMSTMAEFSGIDAPADHDRALRVFKSARGVLKGLNFEVTSQWVGSRPSTPDALPIIGRSPNFRNVLFAFGHGHLGITFGAVTGKIISQLAMDAQPNMDISAYRPDRDYAGAHLPRSPHA